MSHSRHPSHGGLSQSFEMERKYSVPSNIDSRSYHSQLHISGASEDLHAWSIYRQNLNSDFTDSALGSTDKSPLPYGNFQLRDTTVQSILSHPRYGPKSALGSNMYTYLKFGLPRVFPPNGSNRSGTPVGGGGGGGGPRDVRDGPRGEHGGAGGRIPTNRPPHMRSSKHNIRGVRDGSSGYDSSDNETTHQQYKQNRKYRSDPDFRFPQYHGSSTQHAQIPLAAMEQSRRDSNWNRNKSISEANLLSSEAYNRHSQYNIMNRRNSVADFGPESVLMSPPSQLGRPISKAESHMSIAQSRRSHAAPSVIRSDYLAHDQVDMGSNFLYPHLQVRALDVTSPINRDMLLLQNVSFEIRGGEIMAIMATTELEGTGLLNVLAGKKSHIGGDIIINGQSVSKRALRSRVAYVQCDAHFCEDMTVQQMLRFHYELKKPTDKLGHLKIDAIDRINVLIEDLGLEQVRNTKICSMTTSEKRRLNVACHLLLDTDIVILDQPTKGMDIFDTFFLVEYLRQWANGGTGNSIGRIVILTLHPPTYEIFTMLSRVLLISAGRVMFSGRRRDMLPYFALVEYPCPSFKNPSDYYLDLVTLDDLSAEAMLESSQRIEQLADIFRRKQEPLSDPGPPTGLPLTVKPANCFKQAYILFLKSLFYTQPNSFLKWISHVILAASISLIVGAIFWDIPSSDPQLLLNDRISFHYTVMCVALWPILITLTVSEIRRNRKYVERDINDGLYGRFVYIFTKIIFNLIPSIFVWITYLVPSYSMSGLYMQGPANFDAFYLYIGYMLLYLSCIQIFMMIFVYTLPTSHFATILAGICLMAMFMICGYTVHFNDLTMYTNWLEYVSPTKWLFPIILNKEFAPEAIASSRAVYNMLCRDKQVRQHQDIIVQLPCPPPNGTQVLANFEYLFTSPHVQTNYPDTPLALLAFYGICFVLTCFGFILNCCRPRKQEMIFKKGRGDPNKP